MSTCSALSTPIIAFDPGKDKCGVAVVAWQEGATHVCARQVVSSCDAERVVQALQEQWNTQQIILGDATTSSHWRARLEVLLPQIEIAIVEEAGSTLEARAFYWREHPPRGWRRVLPLSLQIPPEPIDDFAAIVLANRYFHQFVTAR